MPRQVLLDIGFCTKLWDGVTPDLPNMTPEEGQCYKVSRDHYTQLGGFDHWKKEDIAVYFDGEWEQIRELPIQ